LQDFLEFFFVHEHLARYLTPVSDREEPWWFFAGVFLLGSLPWTVSSLRVLAGGWRRRAPATGEFQPILFLWVWVIFIGVFFSLSDSKLMPYILPVMPALALLIAALPPQTLRRDFLITAMLTIVMGAGLGLASLNWARVIASSDRSAYFMPLARPVGQAALLLMVSGAFVLAGRARGATRAAVFLGAGWCLAWLVLIRAAALLAPVYSGVDLAAALSAAEREAPLYSVRTYDQTVTFYLRRTVTLVAYRGELDYGLSKAPDAEIADVAEFLRRWSPQAPAFAVMEKSMFDDLKNRGVPMRLIAHTWNRVLVARQ
jgi:4-amino-4-deoxy-L-arabinose transferase-like glycosyltransferase